MRKRRSRARRGTQHLERQFDHRFGVGPRHQRRGRELQRQPPEFLVARECARPVRRRDAAARIPQAATASAAVSGRLAAAINAGEIETERRADQNPRVEFGRFDCAGFAAAPSARAARSRRFVRRRDRSRVTTRNIAPSSPRKQGPITPRHRDVGGGRRYTFATTSACGYGSLRFAGTNRSMIRETPSAAVPDFASLIRATELLTPRRPGRRAARPDARSSARRSIRRALRPRSPAAVCRASG